MRALRRIMWKDFALAAAIRFVWSCTLLLSAFYFVRTLVAYVANRQDNFTGYGYLLAVMFFLSCFIMSVASQQLQHLAGLQGMRVRSALITAVYRKALSLEIVSPSDAVNLVATDCQRLQDACTNIHYLWASPIECLAIVGLLIILIGKIGLVALGMIFLVFPIQLIVGRQVAKLRAENIKRTDARVGVMNEVLQAIKLIKLYAWEKSFVNIVKQYRKHEEKSIADGATYKSVNLTVVFIIPPLTALVVFLAYLSENPKLDATIAFTVLSLFNTLRFPLVVLPNAVKNFVESIESVKRLQAYLLAPSCAPRSVNPNAPPIVSFENATISYPVKERLDNGKDYIEGLSNVNLVLRPGELMAVVGPLGAGKSTLLMGMLGEARVTEGKANINGSFSYVPQFPWVQAGTVRQNILFGLEYNEEKYREVLFACALEADVKMLPNGDLSEIAERGINLSGGQRQRISLARAAYAGAQIVLLDGPLSAVDWHTANHIMKYCIKGIMKGATIVMVTHQLHLLDQFDVVAVIDKGRVEYCGPFQRETLRQYFPSVEKIDSLPEKTPEEKEVKRSQSLALPRIVHAPSNSKTSKKLKKPTDNTIGSGASFAAWVRSGGVGWFTLAVNIATLTQIIRILSDWWISAWTADRFDQSNSYYLNSYALFVVAFFILLLLRGSSFFAWARFSGTAMHNKMFARVLQAPMYWFIKTPLGQVLNCFAGDQDITDEGLPDVTMVTLVFGLILATTIILVCVVLPLYAVVGAALVISFVVFLLFYVKTASLLKTMAANTAAPIVSQISETLTGIAVVRSFRAQERLQDYSIRLLDRNHNAMFHLSQLQLWLAFRLDLIASILVFLTAILALAKTDLAPAVAGLAISNSLQMLVFFTWVVRGIADIASLLSSVGRIQHLTNTVEQEAAHEIEDKRPPELWPASGEIQFVRATMSYAPGLPPALRQVNLHIKAAEKIGIVGRTGSGKSSLVMALFRMCELSEGVILVDGQDVGKFGLADTRRRMAIIPQEPVMFKGTVWSNLDPFCELMENGKIPSDVETKMWRALQLSHMKAAIEVLPLKLYAEVEDNGANFSLGQRQLICLARAILSNSSILVLDEATAAMDLETDALIQKTVKEQFENRTVITIAHRLDTIINSDRILGMAAGQVVEFDTPANLLARPDSFFSGLVASAGNSAEVLRQQVMRADRDKETERVERRTRGMSAAPSTPPSVGLRAAPATPGMLTLALPAAQPTPAAHSRQGSRASSFDRELSTNANPHSTPPQPVPLANAPLPPQELVLAAAEEDVSDSSQEGSSGDAAIEEAGPTITLHL